MPTKINEVPSKEWLNFYYYEEGGNIYWRQREMSRGRPSVRAGKRVTTFEQEGYMRVRLKGKYYMLSRIVYQITYGDLTPEFEIDHIDRNRLNNTVSNLRKVTQGTNKRNKSRQINSGDDVGVTLCRKKHPAPYEHQVTEYWVARWNDLDGKLKTKCFRIDKLGWNEAYNQAVEYRKCMILRLNELGAGYTEDHGE